MSDSKSTNGFSSDSARSTDEASSDRSRIVSNRRCSVVLDDVEEDILSFLNAHVYTNGRIFLTEKEFESVLLKEVGPYKINSGFVKHIFHECDVEDSGNIAAENLACYIHHIKESSKWHRMVYSLSRVFREPTFWPFVLFVIGSTLSISNNILHQTSTNYAAVTAVIACLVMWAYAIGSFILFWVALKNVHSAEKKVSKASNRPLTITNVLRHLWKPRYWIDYFRVLGCILWLIGAHSKQIGWSSQVEKSLRVSGALSIMMVGIILFPMGYQAVYNHIVQTQKLKLEIYSLVVSSCARQCKSDILVHSLGSPRQAQQSSFKCQARGLREEEEFSTALVDDMHTESSTQATTESEPTLLSNPRPNLTAQPMVSRRGTSIGMIHEPPQNWIPSQPSQMIRQPSQQFLLIVDRMVECSKQNLGPQEIQVQAQNRPSISKLPSARLLGLGKDNVPCVESKNGKNLSLAFARRIQLGTLPANNEKLLSPAAVNLVLGGQLQSPTVANGQPSVAFTRHTGILGASVRNLIHRWVTGPQKEDEEAMYDTKENSTTCHELYAALQESGVEVNLDPFTAVFKMIDLQGDGRLHNKIFLRFVDGEREAFTSADRHGEAIRAFLVSKAIWNALTFFTAGAVFAFSWTNPISMSDDAALRLSLFGTLFFIGSSLHSIYLTWKHSQQAFDKLEASRMRFRERVIEDARVSV